MDANFPQEFVPGRAVVLTPRVRRITAPNPSMMTGPGTNTYLVGCARIAVIDVGSDAAEHVGAILAAGQQNIEWICVTHGHSDHAPGAFTLSRLTGAPVIGYGTRGYAPGERFSPHMRVRAGFTIAAEDWALTAVHTPGHARDHLCYVLEPEGLLFSGDHIMQGSTVVIAPPDGNMAAYLASLDELAELALRRIAPGHGSVIEHPREEIRRIAAHRRGREREIVDLLSQCGPMRIAQLVSVMYANVSPALHEWAALSVYAHLRKLREDGRVNGNSRDHRWRMV